MIRADFDSKGRKMIPIAGRASDTIPVQEKTKLMKAGVSLKNIP